MLAFPLPYYVILGSGLTVFVRYMVPIVPFLCLTAAVFVDRLADSIGRSLETGRARDVSTVALAAIVMIPTAISSVSFDRLMTKVDTRVIAAGWIASYYPSGASIYQNGYGFAQVRPKPRERYEQRTFNEQTNRFERDGRPIDSPDLIVLLESPLAVYTRVPVAIAALITADYTLVDTSYSLTALQASATVYDQDDAFFAPFSGIENARRPGPNVSVFQRRARR